MTTKDFSGSDAEYRDYARDAKRLAVKAQELAREAEASKSRAALNDAISALGEASAMHTRAALSADAGGIESAGHLAHVKVINDMRRELRAVRPRTK